MPFKKGESGNAKGKPPGATNLITRTVKETVLAAFNALQEDPKANLITWGSANPGQFYPIAARLIPTELQANLMGKLELKRPSWYDEQPKEATIILLPQQIQQEAVGD